MEAFKWSWQYIRQYKFRMLGGLLMVLMFATLGMINPYVSGIIVDRVILGRETGLLGMLLLLMVGGTLMRSILKYSYQMIFEYVSQDILFKMRVKIYSRLQELDFAFFDKTRTGDIMTRMTNDTDMVRHFVAWVIYNTFESGATFIFAMIVLSLINLRFALVLLAVTPVTGYFAYRFAGKVKPTFAAIREQFSRLNSMVQENISGNRVVKAFAKEDHEIEKFTRENEAFRQRNMDSARVSETYLPVLETLAGLLSVIMIIIGGIMVVNKALTLGELVTFNSFIWALNNPMRMAGVLINDTQRFAASAEKVISLLNTEPQIKNSDNMVQKDRLKGMVEFRNVSFTYGDEKVLEGINLKVKPGQIIAVIGPTGSGKSTLVNLICRFYDCTGGEVLIDGLDIKEIDVRKLRENVAVAMQDIFLFSDTIEGNIAYGVPDAPIESVEWAAKIAGASEFIANFPEGYNTIIGERGVGLSGGQKQRIALARALLKNPSILILDDTTSSIDVETEHAIHKSLKSCYTDRTTFIIAHRISSVKDADMILVLDNGKIVEKGRHDELLQKRGYYYSVFANQFGDFDNVYGMEVG